MVGPVVDRRRIRLCVAVERNVAPNGDVLELVLHPHHRGD